MHELGLTLLLECCAAYGDNWCVSDDAHVAMRRGALTGESPYRGAP